MMVVRDDEFDEVIEMVDGDISLGAILAPLVMLRSQSILRAYINENDEALQDSLTFKIPISTYSILCDELSRVNSKKDVNDYISICQNQIEYEIMFLQMDAVHWQFDKYTNRLYNKGNPFQSYKVLHRHYEIDDEYFTIKVTLPYVWYLLVDSYIKQQEYSNNNNEEEIEAGA